MVATTPPPPAWMYSPPSANPVNRRYRGAVMIAHPTLRQRLEDVSRFDAEYGASLSNHLPMALTALVRLGASDERLNEFSQRYARRLHEAPPIEPWPGGDPWRARMGEPRAWPAYRQLFREWVAVEGGSTVLSQALPALMQGVGAAAFHGPIRAAYALAANHADGLADALAYWACRWFDCGSASLAGGPAIDPADLPHSLDFPMPARRLITEGMAHAAAQPRFVALCRARHVDAATTLPRLARQAAAWYAASADFTVLHLTTSAHAMQVLLLWLDEDDRPAALAHYAAAYAAGVAAARDGMARQAAQRSAVAVLPWPEIVARAVESDDDHFIKLVDSARELEAAYGGDVWSQAASRAAAEHG